MAKKVNIPPQVIFYGISTLIIVWVIYLALKRIGLIKSATKIRAEKDEARALKELRNAEFFNPNLYKEDKYSLVNLLSNDVANQYAKDIKKSWGWFNDDEAAVYSVFRKMANKIQISQIADAYAQLYKADLLGDIEYYLNAKERAFLWNIIDSKPFKTR